jgi:hypothetical protein
MHLSSYEAIECGQLNPVLFENGQNGCIPLF